MNKIFSLLLPLLFFFYASTAIAEECLKYEPEKVELSGTIVEKTFPGPPEYESIKKRDIPLEKDLPTTTKRSFFTTTGSQNLKRVLRETPLSNLSLKRNGSPKKPTVT